MLGSGYIILSHFDIFTQAGSDFGIEEPSLEALKPISAKSPRTIVPPIPKRVAKILATCPYVQDPMVVIIRMVAIKYKIPNIASLMSIVKLQLMKVHIL